MTDAPSHVSPDARQVLIYLNPTAGARSGRTKVERLAALLRDEDYEVDIVRDIERFAEDPANYLATRQLRAIVAAGGDGTVSLVVNRTPPGAPIALLPLGTENLLSKYLTITPDVESVCRTICHGRIIKLDAGKAGDRVFLLMVGCGFDAEVVRRLHHERTGHIHHLSYVKPILQSIRNYQYPKLRVYFAPDDVACGDRTRKKRVATQPVMEPIAARWVFIVNVPRYACGLRLTPDAIGHDGLLNVCTFKKGSIWNGLRYLGGVVLGQHQSWQDCATATTRRVRIESDEPVPYQLDGDPGGYLPLEIKILPERVTLLAPPKTRGRGNRRPRNC